MPLSWIFLSFILVNASVFSHVNFSTCSHSFGFHSHFLMSSLATRGRVIHQKAYLLDFHNKVTTSETLISDHKVRSQVRNNVKSSLIMVYVELGLCNLSLEFGLTHVVVAESSFG